MRKEILELKAGMNLSECRLDYSKKMVEKYGLDLSGISIVVEHATGDYLYTATMAMLAGAEEVFLLSPERDPDYRKAIFEVADIVTNSGKVRPITKEDIENMKPGSVIAAMMSREQTRKGDVDQKACEKKNVSVAYVNEEELGIYDSIGFKILKAIFAAGMGGWHESFLLFSTGPLKRFYQQALWNNGIQFQNFQDLFSHKIDLKDYDAIILADHYDSTRLLGEKGMIPVSKIVKENPLLKIINIAGLLSEKDLKLLQTSGIEVFPSFVSPKGHTNLSGSFLSYRVVIELNAAGIKAAQDLWREINGR